MIDKPPRLTPTSFAVLALVDHLGEATPYDLKQAIEKSVENFWPVPHTTFYAEPDRLARSGYLTLNQEAAGRRRKLYALTDAGRDALHDWAHSPNTAPPQLRDEGVLKVFAGGDPVAIFSARRGWHEGKLAELEGYLGGLAGEDAATEASRATLMAGISYHRMTLEAIERFLAGVRADTARR